MSGSRVQVLTLAELAFTILFALIIVSLPQVIEGKRTVAELKRAAAELAEARQTIEERDKRIKELEETRSAGKISNIWPPCAEEPLERLTIVGPDEFLIGDSGFNSRAIETRHGDELQRAERNKCRHRVVVSWQHSLGASELDAALKRLERNFYIRRAGSVAKH